MNAVGPVMKLKSKQLFLYNIYIFYNCRVIFSYHYLLIKPKKKNRLKLLSKRLHYVRPCAFKWRFIYSSCCNGEQHQFFEKNYHSFPFINTLPQIDFLYILCVSLLSEAPFIKQISSWKSTPKHMNIRQILRVFFRETKFQQIFKWNLVLTLFSMADPQKAG